MRLKTVDIPFSSNQESNCSELYRLSIKLTWAIIELFRSCFCFDTGLEIPTIYYYCISGNFSLEKVLRQKTFNLLAKVFDCDLLLPIFIDESTVK